jgi:hypothetical protein
MVIMLMMAFFVSRTQNYHSLVDTNKLWSVAHQYFPGLWNQFSDFTKFQGEEILQGNIYKKVWTTTDTTLANWNFSGYIRENSGNGKIMDLAHKLFFPSPRRHKDTEA